MAKTAKKKAVKRAYVKRAAYYWRGKKEDQPQPEKIPGGIKSKPIFVDGTGMPITGQQPEPQQNNRDLVGVILHAIDRLNKEDKARVLAYALGKRQVSQNEMWAIQKLLKD